MAMRGCARLAGVESRRLWLMTTDFAESLHKDEPDVATSLPLRR
jgi:hypothetical protein